MYTTKIANCLKSQKIMRVLVRVERGREKSKPETMFDENVTCSAAIQK